MKARQVKSKTTSIEELTNNLHNAFQIEYSCLYFKNLTFIQTSVIT